MNDRNKRAIVTVTVVFGLLSAEYASRFEGKEHVDPHNHTQYECVLPAGTLQIGTSTSIESASTQIIYKID